GLQAARDRRGIERREALGVAEHVCALDPGVAAREVRDPQLVDEMRTAVGAGEGHRRVVDGEQERGDAVAAALLPGSRSGHCRGARQHDGAEPDGQRFHSYTCDTHQTTSRKTTMDVTVTHCRRLDWRTVYKRAEGGDR